jgi:tripartite-type tricarboxylate transporter receptor subunit TctC
MKRTRILSALAAGVILPLALTSTQAQEACFEGDTITIVIGAKGGSLTVAAELVGRHIAKHLEGNPTVINQQMPGGAHLIATNHVFNVAEPDGTTILAVNPNVAVAQLSGVESVQFDVREFQWLGSTGSDGAMFAISAELPYQTWEELKDSGETIKAGSTGPGSNAHDFPLFLKEFAEGPIELIPGYPANSDVLLAVERGEVDAWSAFGSTVSRAANRGSVRPLVRTRTEVPGYEDLPVDEDLATSDIGRRLMGVRGIPLSIGRAFAVPPGTPEECVTELREAFAEMIEDPEFLAEAEKAEIIVDYIPPEQVQQSFEELMDQPPEVLAAVKEYIKIGD